MVLEQMMMKSLNKFFYAMKKLSLREGVIILLSLLVSCTPTSDDILLEEEITKVEFMLPDSSISADS